MGIFNMFRNNSNSSDEETLNYISKSLQNEDYEEFNSKGGEESLSKAFDKAKLVQKEIQVKGKNGQIHTRKQWVKAGEEQSNSSTTSKPKDSQVETKAQAKKTSISFKLKNGEESKRAISEMLISGVTRDTLMEEAEKQGITWKKCDNVGINWMRASMAIQKYMNQNKSSKDVTKQEQPKQKQKQNNVTKKPLSFSKDLQDDVTYKEYLEDCSAEDQKDLKNAIKESGINTPVSVSDDSLSRSQYSISDMNKKSKLIKTYGRFEVRETETGERYVYTDESGMNAIFASNSSKQTSVGINCKKFFEQYDDGLPSSPLEAFHAVNDASDDFGGLKVGDSVFIVNNDLTITEKKEGKTVNTNVSEKVVYNKILKEMNIKENKTRRKNNQSRNLFKYPSNTDFEKLEKRGMPLGIDCETFFVKEDFELPKTSSEARDIVEFAFKNYGGFKVGNSRYGIGNDNNIVEKRGGEFVNSDVDIKELFKKIQKEIDEKNVSEKHQNREKYRKIYGS